MKKLQIGVMGPAKSEYPSEIEEGGKLEKVAEMIGQLLAGNNVIVFTGGCDGIMEATLRGAKKKKGFTVGIPGRERGTSNKYTDVEILADIDIGSFVFAGLPSCDSLIFIPGGAGTLAELCIAYRMKKPIIIMKGFNEWYDSLVGKYIDNGKIVKCFGAKTPEEAVELAIKLAKEYMKTKPNIK